MPMVRLSPVRHAGLLLLLDALLAPGVRADPVDDYVRAEIARRKVPAVSLAVVKDGEVIKTAAYGLADLELDVPATPETVFQIQSITKTFTSTAILMLVEEGKLALDDPLSRHLEGTPESWKDITLRHLLSHTSGIKDFINEPTASLRLDVTEEDVLRATAPRPLNFPPGDRWAYSNTNYHLLAMVIRKVTGMWYGDFLAERIFRPLGMSHTRVVSLHDLVPHRASGYHLQGDRLVKGEFVAEPILAYGGGGIISTAPDMARWAAACLSAKLLKPETIAQAWTPARFNDGGSAAYGLGWMIAPVDGHREIGHSGSHITGFTSYLALYPDDHLGVVVLTNSSSANPRRIARRVASLIGTLPPPRPPSPIEDREPEVTALLRDCIERGADWTLDPAKFTPRFWKAAEEQRASAQLLLKALGKPRTLELLSRSEGGGLRTYRYRVAFALRVFDITMSLASDGKVAGIASEEE